MLKPRTRDYAALNLAASASADAAIERRRARELEKDYDEVVARSNERRRALIEEAGGNMWGTQGLTHAGYTNNLDREVQLVVNHWVLHYAPLSDPSYPDRYCTGYLTEGQEYARSRLTEAQKRDINLRALCRMEWFDWCMHSNVMTKALLDMSLGYYKDHKKVRHQLRLQGVKFANMQERAMHIETAEEERAKFEQARYDYWKGEGNIQFKRDPDDGVWCPSTDATRAVNPDARFDLHLPAGIIAMKTGINIATRKEARCFRNRLAASILGGCKDKKSNRHYV